MKLTFEKIEKVDAKKQKIIEEYLGYQEDFKKLQAKWIINKLEVNQIQEEPNFDGLTEKEITEIERIKDEESKKAKIAELPKHDVVYLKYMLWAYYIWDDDIKKVISLSEIDIDALKVINKVIKQAIETYKDLLDK